MSEADRYKPTSREGRIARTVESIAARDFGQERLTRENLAKSFNLSVDQISEAEWREIEEFSVNAGSDILRTYINTRTYLREKDEGIERFALLANWAKLSPVHDVFHAAEVYRLTQAQRADARFIRVAQSDRYTSPDVLEDEFYPVLFLTDDNIDRPLPVLMSTDEDRARLVQILAKKFSYMRAEDLEDLLAVVKRPVPATAEERRADYEELLKRVLVGNARQSGDDSQGLDDDQIKVLKDQYLQSAAKDKPHYQEFAARVFNNEWRDNPRLFLDEFLYCIRTPPAPLELAKKKTD